MNKFQRPLFMQAVGVGDRSTCGLDKRLNLFRRQGLFVTDEYQWYAWVFGF